MAALWADRSLALEEKRYLDHLVEVLATSSAERKALREIARNEVDSEGILQAVEELDEKTRRLVFDRCLEALKSDKTIRPRDLKFLNRLRRACGVGRWDTSRRLLEASLRERVQVVRRWPLALVVAAAAVSAIAVFWDRGKTDPETSTGHLPFHYEVVTEDDLDGGEELDGAELYEAVRRAVVTVRVLDGFDPVASGSGSVLGVEAQDRSYVLTNRHVVTAGPGIKRPRYEVQLEDGGRYWAELDTVSLGDDLALLVVDGVAEHTTALALSLRDTLAVGQRVYALGSPAGLRHSLTEGVISALREDYVQTDATVHFGSSGGPLLNAYGQVCGVVTRAHVHKDLNFALYADSVVQMLDERRMP